MKADMRAYFEANQPCTCAEVARALDICAETVRLQYRLGNIHISGWERDPHHNRYVPHYSLGSGQDARKPPPWGIAEYMRQWRSRNAAALYARKVRSQRLGVWKGLM